MHRVALAAATGLTIGPLVKANTTMQTDQPDRPENSPARGAGTLHLDPLDRLIAEHAQQLELCDALEFIADGLPSRFERKLLREVINVLAHGMALHFDFEEEVLFPLLRRRAGVYVPLVAALDQLEIEHQRDGGLCGELVEELRLFLLQEQPRNAEMLGYMLRGYFESQRRHIEWENSIILPAARRLLTAQDCAELASRLQRAPRRHSSIGNLMRDKR